MTIVRLPPRDPAPGLDDLPLMLPDSLAGAHDRAAEHFPTPRSWEAAAKVWRDNLHRMQPDPLERVARALDELASALRALRQE